jgi:Cys-tRNA(Pro)/Cys-tRNA(Cys) deacylase
VDELPAAVERVVAFLREAGAESRIEEFSEDTATAEAAARAVGRDASEIVKSLVTLCDGKPVLALVPGDRRADTDKVARAAGASSARVARGDEVRAITGFAPGAVAPFPLPKVDVVLIERSLLAHASVWVGAGSARHLAVLPTPELVRLTKARSADLVSEL